MNSHLLIDYCKWLCDCGDSSLAGPAHHSAFWATGC